MREISIRACFTIKKQSPPIKHREVIRFENGKSLSFNAYRGVKRTGGCPGFDQ